ncbi:MAG: efflux RND transporter periplasmic adaptor subunit [Lentisphaeria bacterium]|nr:efflux RND transporter periplasmic adaptor subunit [Lentisphaeria bacterium]
MKKWIYSLTAVAALTGCGVFAAEKASAPAVPPTVVLVEKVSLQSESVEKKYVGWLEAIEAVSLPSRVSGVLQKRHFNEGAPVKKGDLLFEIEDTTYLAQVKLAKSQIKQLEAELVFARNNYNRQKNLRSGNAVSEIVYEEAERALHMTEAALDGARAKLLDAENNLSYTKIYAPISGIIGKSAYSVGNYITPASGELANIVQINPLYIRFAISSRELQDMFQTPKQMLQNAAIRLLLPDGTPYKHDTKITMLDNQIDNQTGTITIWATVQNPQSSLRPGGYMPVLLRNASAPDLPAVTLSAVMVGEKGHYVYVLDEQNKIESRHVEIGRINGPWQLIRSGLKPGETVIVDGNHKVQPGMVVSPVPAAAR